MFKDMSDGEIRTEMLSFTGTYGYTYLCMRELSRRKVARDVACRRAKMRSDGVDYSWLRLVGS